MTGSWIAYALMIGCLLAAMAWCLDEVCRLAGRPTRWVWAGSLALAAALIGMAPYRGAPVSSEPRVPPSVAPVANTGINAGYPLAALHRTATRPSPLQAIKAMMHDAAVAADEFVPPAAGRSIAVLWAALSTLLLAAFAAVYLQLRRARRRWPVAALQDVRVRVAPATGPLVVGLRRPEIVVPHWLLTRSTDEQRVVLAHESEHVRARDPLLLAFGCAGAALLPWHPAVWWMLSRLRLAVELDCDARVLRRGVAPKLYGNLLIDLAGHGSSVAGAAALADKSSHLQQRLLAMKPVRTRFALARGGMLGIVAALSLMAAWTAQVPTVAAQVGDRAKQGDAGRIVAADTTTGSSMASQDSTADGDSANASKTTKLRLTGVRPETTQAGAGHGTRVTSAAPSEEESLARLQTALAAAQAAQQELQAAIAEARGTRALAVVNADSAMQAVPVQSVTDLLHGRAPGLTVQRTLKAPDDPARLRLRGVGATPQDPIVVVDGVRIYAGQSPDGTPTPSPMDNIDPNSIETIDVLKGPSAVTLYGQDAANGVIMITTKKGTKKAP